MNFRYDIGVLRAIAVIAVVLFHFQIPYFQGGFIGVDIFFVISGYLMTANILKGFQNENFSFKSFYRKRVQRIIPALLFMLSGTLIAAYFTLLPKDIITIKEYAYSSLIFISNIAYYLNSGYFENASQSNFLLHTWSLSVEWQFYMIYPVILFPFRNHITQNKTKSILLFSVLILLSFLAMLYFNEKDNSFAFYMFPTRAWEMLLGGLVFLLQRVIKINNLYNVIISMVCYILLGFCIYSYTEKDIPWPSYYTLIPVFATALIILLQWECKWSKSAVIQFLGKISYSWYLWHWPLFVFSCYYALTGTLITISLLLFSMTLATLSYYLIESNKKLSSMRTVGICAFACILLCLGIGYAQTNVQESEIQYLSHYNEKYREANLAKQFRRGTCHIDIEHTFEQFDKKGCLFIHPSKENILLIGDSHAGALAYSFESQLASNGANFMQATVSTTYPLLDTKGPKNSVKVIDYIYKTFIPQNASKIDKIYITGFWGSGQYDYSTLKSKLQNLILYLKKHKIDYTIIGQTPAYTMSYPEVLALEKKLKAHLEDKYTWKQAKDYNIALRKDFTGNDYLEVYSIPFVKYQNKQCYLYDDDHLSIFGADQLVKYILYKLQK